MSQIDGAESAAVLLPSTGRRKLFPTPTGWFDQPAAGVAVPLTNAQKATTPEMEAGTETAARDMSPFDIKLAIDALSPRLASFTLQADQFDNPNNPDWAVNKLAPSAKDSNNNAITIRRFDDSTEEGVGFLLKVPAGMTQLRIGYVSRAKTAPPAVRTVGIRLYEREIPDNAAITAWSAGTQLTDLDMPTNEFFQNDTETKTLASLGLIAGNTHQLELTRIAPTGGTNLNGDWNLLQITIEFLP